MVAANVKNIEHLPLRLMFQDEARFGRMTRSSILLGTRTPPTSGEPGFGTGIPLRICSRESRGWLFDFMTAEKMNTDNMSLLRLPPYSPELNPAEQIWNKLRRDYFANRVFDSLGAATTQAEQGLAEMAVNKPAIGQLTNWPWISAIMKA